ncbi:hypothetical protein [Tenacibaculum finnmarkense]|uniref:hypothetical protein n=1 Tax=Tenacibaculum finnmarkense TaxID=2781243 RepID=UPI001E4BE193|nr:hypothetical protein [Tenacibaculum finnmarkense]MCD8399804.1 hypothetical protein [Tenacibaculum finnmarkense genomovar ulcerans]MCG8235455.1 hypothetical protein [Tenacibaculum finnmarkense genomovar ulcerans]MCG8762327.1 hypothetical protein [Tenacibaculum finnmarkense]MCG8784365.1 hypothetical protein [Tenacibaculum finnmarkense]MCG8787921.1 hypothetical protein [Tenacibaculum finnmarkense]
MILNATEGQLEITMDKPAFNKFSFKDAGLKEDSYTVEGGNLRLKIALGYIQDYRFYKMPVIELEYENNIKESGWIVEFNGENILEAKDHSGSKTVLLLNRNKMSKLVHRHENTLIIHGDFSEAVKIKNTSTLNLLEAPSH